MTLAFYMDEHVPRPITEALLAQGLDVLTAQEDGHDHRPDEEVVDRATSLGRILFSLDRHMPAIATRRQVAGLSFSGIVYSRLHGLAVQWCVDDLVLVARLMSAEEIRNQLIYIPL